MKLQTCCFNDGRQRPLRFPYQPIGAFAATTNLQYALPDRLQTGEFLLNRGRGRGIGKATDDLPAMDPIAELVDGPVVSLFRLHKTLTFERRTVFIRQPQGRQCGKLDWPRLGSGVAVARGAQSCRHNRIWNVARRMGPFMRRVCEHDRDDCRLGWNGQAGERRGMPRLEDAGQAN
jgi:hypothetical protein